MKGSVYESRLAKYGSGYWIIMEDETCRAAMDKESN